LLAGRGFRGSGDAGPQHLVVTRFQEYQDGNPLSFFSTLEHEVLSPHHFTTKAQARTVVLAWCHEFYNTQRRRSSAAMMAPADYEQTAAQRADGKEAA
jgi:hypothetical protein